MKGPETEPDDGEVMCVSGAWRWNKRSLTAPCQQHSPAESSLSLLSSSSTLRSATEPEGGYSLLLLPPVVCRRVRQRTCTRTRKKPQWWTRDFMIFTLLC
ncbi:hypothetical protein C0Q70_03094 [Pomacea canaliculata]|uniref:Uncharacterized protein n=1 Tax=Pomacea canaliculata TaxID=400727 RepID=A0A2T7PRR8_POMCA|nr:hypothetical protein C0Q70_03094 [Pomacea canaliculata]